MFPGRRARVRFEKAFASASTRLGNPDDDDDGRTRRSLRRPEWRGVVVLRFFFGSKLAKSPSQPVDRPTASPPEPSIPMERRLGCRRPKSGDSRGNEPTKATKAYLHTYIHLLVHTQLASCPGRYFVGRSNNRPGSKPSSSCAKPASSSSPLLLFPFHPRSWVGTWGTICPSIHARPLHVCWMLVYLTTRKLRLGWRFFSMRCAHDGT